jgi:hypothetical protein
VQDEWSWGVTGSGVNEGDMRERASSLSSCRSLRSRHYSSCIVDDLESDVSYVSTQSLVVPCM